MRSAEDAFDLLVARRKLEALFRKPPKKAPFEFGQGKIVPVKLIPSAVARFADAKGWPVFGAATPASRDEVISALSAAKFGIERLDRVKYRGKVKSGLFAIGLDVADGPPAPLPDGAEKTAFVTLFRCGCGYATVDATSMKNHGEACELERERIPRAAVRRVDDGPGDFRTSAFACANPACKFGKMGRVWLHREAAYAHRKARGCELTKTKASYEILERR